MEIVESFLTQNPCYKAGKKIKVAGLMLHSVGCPQPSAEVFVKNWNNPASGRACVHAFIDANTGKIYQTLPWEHRGWHCGGSGNNTHIGVEMCEPDCIKYTGGASFRCVNEEKAKAMAKRTYDRAVDLFAVLCKTFGLNPLADGVIISHKEGHSRGIASGHGDPEHLWNGLKTGYTMDGFRKAVSEAMEQSQSPSVPDYPIKPLPPVPPLPEQGQPVMPPPPEPGTVPVPIYANEEMSISDRGVELIAKYEGCRLAAYKCPAGVWTIGYGHTAGVKPGDTLPNEQAAKNLLKQDLKKYAGYVNDCIKKGNIIFPLNQNRFDALTSFAYNCGAGNLQKLVSGRDAETVAEKLLLYNKGGGKVLAGLTRRREEERALFLG